MARVTGNDIDFPESVIDFANDVAAIDTAIGEVHGKRRKIAHSLTMPDVTKFSAIFNGDGVAIDTDVLSSVIINTGDVTTDSNTTATNTTANVVAIGSNFDLTGVTNSIMVGASNPFTTYSNTVALGYGTSTNGQNQVVLGNSSSATIPNQTVLGTPDIGVTNSTNILTKYPAAVGNGSGTVPFNPIVLSGTTATKGLYVGKLIVIVRDAVANRDTVADYGTIVLRVSGAATPVVTLAFPATTATPTLLTNIANKNADVPIVATDLNMAVSGGQLLINVPQRTTGTRTIYALFDGVINTLAG